MMILLMRLTIQHLMLITQLTTFHLTATIMTMMKIHLHPPLSSHNNTLYQLSDPLFHCKLLPLPWTSAIYTPKMPMDYGAERAIAKAISLQTVTTIQPNWSTWSTKCEPMTLTLGSSKRHGCRMMTSTLMLAATISSDISHQLAPPDTIICFMVLQ